MNNELSELRRLEFLGGEYWVDVKPSDALIYNIAGSRAAKFARAFRDIATCGDALESLGFDADTWDDLTDPAVLTGFTQLLLAIEVGVLIIQDWNVGTTDGDVAPINRDSVTQFMRHLSNEFMTAERADTIKVLLAGNVLPRLPNGAASVETNTAKAADPKGSPAPTDDRG